jgi:histone H1/5
MCDRVSVDRMAFPGTLTAFLRAVPSTSPVTPGAARLRKCTKGTVGASMSKKDDTSKTLKKKLKKLKKLQAEIAALKAAVNNSKSEKPAKEAAAKDKKSAKAAGKKTKGKAKKAKAAKKGDGKAAPETVTKTAMPSLVRPEPVKAVAKEATSVPASPSARVATG